MYEEVNNLLNSDIIKSSGFGNKIGVAIFIDFMIFYSQINNKKEAYAIRNFIEKFDVKKDEFLRYFNMKSFY